MSSRIKGLFSSKKKKEDIKAKPRHSKEIFASSSSAQASISSLSSKNKAMSIGSFASSTSAFDLQRESTVSTRSESTSNLLTPSSTTAALDIIKLQSPTPLQSNASSTSASTPTPASTFSRQDMTTDSIVQDVTVAHKAPKEPPSPPPSSLTPSTSHSQGKDTSRSMLSSPPVSSTAIKGTYEKEKDLANVPQPGDMTPGAHEVSGNKSMLTPHVNQRSNLSRDQDRSIQYDERERSRYSQKQDLSFVDQVSYISASHVDMDQDQDQNQNEGMYLSSTTEFFPIDDQEEQVYLDRYSDEGDEFPVLQLKVAKIQKQVREMRKFMRGLVQLQVEQYEPATILIQAWWRGCLVRRELKKQCVFSWHKNPARRYKKAKYLTRTELHQSCERISAPKPSLLVTADLGAQKEVIATIKLQAISRGFLVRKRVQTYLDGMIAATIIQAAWRGYRTRTLDTRLGVEQLRFRNLKIQKAFGRVSIKLQYLQGRILGLEENSLPLHEAQELIHKEIEDMADQIDLLKQDLEQGLKQLDEQVSEEREQTTIELRGLTERILKLENELGIVKTTNTKIEQQVRTLTLDASDSDEEDEDYEVQYDEDGNRIEKIKSQKSSMALNAGSRRTSGVVTALDTTLGHSPSPMVDSPIPMQMPPHRGSMSSIHSQPNNQARSHSISSQPSSPTQNFPKAFPASYSPTISNSASVPEGGMSMNGRPHSMYQHGSGQHHQQQQQQPPSRPLTMDSNQLFRFHAAANQYIPISPSTGSPAAAAFPPGVQDGKKYVSMDDFEYMQAEVDTLRLNNDRLEGMVRELTLRLNSLTSGPGQPYYSG
ncbi:hypothetical protein MVEG_06656 [Podila verticillata NRRL 6337]|nr:hypothetical protein MVEG_06656 [Podila verticillata NRRL 6337]